MLSADPDPAGLHEKLQGTYNDMKQSTLKTLTFLTYLMRTPTAPNVRPYQVFLGSHPTDLFMSISAYPSDPMTGKADLVICTSRINVSDAYSAIRLRNTSPASKCIGALAFEKTCLQNAPC